MENPNSTINVNNDKLVILGGATKKRILATIEYIKKHPEIKTIVLTGGRTQGIDNLSEAEEMKKYFEMKYPNHEIEFILEEEACDTEDNAEKTIQLLQSFFGKNIEEILLLSDATHLSRAGWAFQRRGVEVQRIVSEYWLGKRSKHHKQYVKKLILSSNFLKQTFVIEPILHALTLFQRGRIFIRSKTENRIK